MLQHKFEIENKDGSKETRTSTLCEYGAPVGSGGYSAMAKLVGVTCAIGKSSRFLGLLSASQRFSSVLPLEDPHLSPLIHKGCLKLLLGSEKRNC